MAKTLTDYTSLITSEHSDKPNFMATLEAIVKPMCDIQAVLASIPAKYDLDVAVGAQLDVLGRWIGLSRRLRVPIPGVYFSFDILGLGFDEGIWYERDNPVEGTVYMDDATYRLMLRAKIAANNWRGSLEEANQTCADLFAGGAVVIQDNFNMSITMTIDGSAPSELFRQLVAGDYIPFRPAGVRLTP